MEWDDLNMARLECMLASVHGVKNKTTGTALTIDDCRRFKPEPTKLKPATDGLCQADKDTLAHLDSLVAQRAVIDRRGAKK